MGSAWLGLTFWVRMADLAQLWVSQGGGEADNRLVSLGASGKGTRPPSRAAHGVGEATGERRRRRRPESNQLQVGPGAGANAGHSLTSRLHTPHKKVGQKEPRHAMPDTQTERHASGTRHKEVTRLPLQEHAGAHHTGLKAG